MLQKLPAEDLAEVRRVMYGVAEDHTPLEVPEEARALGEANNFEIQVLKDISAACASAAGRMRRMRRIRR